MLTDGDLNILQKGPQLILHQPKEILDGMGEWCQQHHSQSGLIDACIASTIDVQSAEKLILEFLLKNNVVRGTIPLAGNSVHVDKQFLIKDMVEICCIK